MFRVVFSLGLAALACACSSDETHEGRNRAPDAGAGGGSGNGATGGSSGSVASGGSAGAPGSGGDSGSAGGSGSSSGGSSGAAGDGAASGDLVREVPGFPMRPYTLHPPNGVLPPSPTPVVLALHGGGGNADSMPRVTCPGGDLSSDGCMNAVADRKGFAVVYPNGTAAAVLPNTRTWNAGGGTGSWQCVSGYACKQGIDDVAYFDALLDDLASVLAVDPKRIFATGISNGAAMSHRLACERADRIAAIAPIAGGNQLSTTASCTPSRPLSILEIHGTADPCWAFAGGSAACAQTDGMNKIDIPTTVADWAGRNGCPSQPTTADLPDSDPSDGTLTHADRYSPCNTGTELVFYRVEGGGHTWPAGWAYQPASAVGPVALDFDADEAMLDFFLAHPMP